MYKDDDDDISAYNRVNLNEAKELITGNICFFSGQSMRNGSQYHLSSQIRLLSNST